MFPRSYLSRSYWAGGYWAGVTPPPLGLEILERRAESISSHRAPDVVERRLVTVSERREE